jgi:hypothetical protein
MHRPGDPRQTAVSDLSKVIADIFLNIWFYFNKLKLIQKLTTEKQKHDCIGYGSISYKLYKQIL